MGLLFNKWSKFSSRHIVSTPNVPDYERYIGIIQGHIESEGLTLDAFFEKMDVNKDKKLSESEFLG